MVASDWCKYFLSNYDNSDKWFSAAVSFMNFIIANACTLADRTLCVLAPISNIAIKILYNLAMIIQDPQLFLFKYALGNNLVSLAFVQTQCIDGGEPRRYDTWTTIRTERIEKTHHEMKHKKIAARVAWKTESCPWYTRLDLLCY